jgi:hypothetical protein
LTIHGEHSSTLKINQNVQSGHFHFPQKRTFLLPLYR